MSNRKKIKDPRLTKIMRELKNLEGPNRSK